MNPNLSLPAIGLHAVMRDLMRDGQLVTERGERIDTAWLARHTRTRQHVVGRLVLELAEAGRIALRSDGLISDPELVRDAAIRATRRAAAYVRWGKGGAA